MNRQLRRLLEAATVRVACADGPHSGTGVIVAPNTILTCASLVGRLHQQQLHPSSKPISIVQGGETRQADIAVFLPDADIALLHAELSAPQCAFLLDTVDMPTSLYCFGYPPGADTGYTCRPNVTGGPTPYDSGWMNLYLPDQSGLSRFSGAALLDEAAGGVCAVVVGAAAVDRERLQLRIDLHAYLTQHFSVSDVKNVCDDMGIDFDKLPEAEQGFGRRCARLIKHVEEQGRLGELIMRASAERPTVPFIQSDLNAPWQSQQSESRRELEAVEPHQSARGLLISSLLDLPKCAGLIEQQRRYHAVHTAWIDTLSAELVLAAPRCYPEQVPPPEPPPYPDWLPFQDSKHFYGRDETINQLSVQLAVPDARLVVLSGPPGSGKTSLIKAGLLPKLEAHPRFTVREFSNIEFEKQPTQSLLKLIGADDGRIETLETDDQQAKRQVLLIDSFEQLLHPIPGDSSADRDAEQNRQQLLDLLVRLRSASKIPLVVLLVVQDNMLDALRGIGLNAQNATISLPPLSEEALKQAISQPALTSGVWIEPALVSRLVIEAGTMANPLRPVQAALILLWNTMQRRRLTLQAYEQSIGSLSRAIHQRATTQLQGMTETERALMQRLLLRLVNFHTLEGSRRPELRERLISVGNDARAAQQLLDKLFDMGLLVDTNKQFIWVELAHDALIGELGLLQEANGLIEGERQRREWEWWVDQWRNSQQLQVLTSEPLIDAAASWQTRYAAELGAVTQLDELIAASREGIAIQKRRVWGLGLLICSVAIFFILAFYLLARPLLPT